MDELLHPIKTIVAITVSNMYLKQPDVDTDDTIYTYASNDENDLGMGYHGVDIVINAY